jgi:hypothetical protein
VISLLPVLLFFISPLSAYEELKNDNGIAMWSYANIWPDYYAYYGARFVCAEGLKIVRAKVYSYSRTPASPCSLFVCSNDGMVPGTRRHETTYVPSPYGWDTVLVAPSIPFDSDFWIVIWIPESDSIYEAFAVTDGVYDYPVRNAIRRTSGPWDCDSFMFSGDLCIRAIVSYDFVAPGAPIGLTANGSSPSPWRNADFDIDWINPYDSSGIAGSWHKLGSPPTHSEDGTYTTSKPFNTGSIAEGVQKLYVWLQDSVANKDCSNMGSVDLRCDLTPPTGSVASSVDTSRTSTFTVSWSSGGDAGGSGLSNRYDVRVDINSTGWSNWKLDFSGLSDTYVGMDENTYYFEAAARDSAGNVEVFTGIPEDTTVVDTIDVGTEHRQEALPSCFDLSQNYPNPFRRCTGLKYALPMDAHVKIAVFDLAGQEVRVLVNERRTAGYHTTTWRGNDRYGKIRANGTYFVRMQANDYLITRKLYLVN